MKNCKECEFCDKDLKTKCRSDYIYCNRLRFWRSFKYLCSLMRPKNYNIKAAMKSEEKNYYKDLIKVVG